MEPKKPEQPELKLGIEYSAQKFDENFLLFTNGKLSICPFQTVNAAISDLGSPQFYSQPCSTKCPLAAIETNEKGIHVYTTYCHGGSIARDLEFITTEPSVIKPHIAIMDK